MKGLQVQRRVTSPAIIKVRHHLQDARTASKLRPKVRYQSCTTQTSTKACPSPGCGAPVLKTKQICLQRWLLHSSSMLPRSFVRSSLLPHINAQLFASNLSLPAGHAATWTTSAEPEQRLVSSMILPKQQREHCVMMPRISHLLGQCRQTNGIQAAQRHQLREGHWQHLTGSTRVHKKHVTNHLVVNCNKLKKRRKQHVSCQQQRQPLLTRGVADELQSKVCMSGPAVPSQSVCRQPTGSMFCSRQKVPFDALLGPS